MKARNVLTGALASLALAGNPNIPVKTEKIPAIQKNLVEVLDSPNKERIVNNQLESNELENSKEYWILPGKVMQDSLKTYWGGEVFNGYIGTPKFIPNGQLVGADEFWIPLKNLLDEEDSMESEVYSFFRSRENFIIDMNKLPNWVKFTIREWNVEDLWNGQYRVSENTAFYLRDDVHSRYWMAVIEVCPIPLVNNKEAMDLNKDYIIWEANEWEVAIDWKDTLSCSVDGGVAISFICNGQNTIVSDEDDLFPKMTFKELIEKSTPIEEKEYEDWDGNQVKDKLYRFRVGGDTGKSWSFHGSPLGDTINVIVRTAISNWIEWLVSDRPSIIAQEGRIILDTKDTLVKGVKIYRIDGQLVHQVGQVQGVETFELPQGIYIVKYGKETVKLAVK